MFTDVTVVGRLTAKPELRKTSGDTAVTNFSLAVNRDFNSDETDFFDVTAWRKLAELVTGYKDKGELILVQGNLRQEKWDQDGQKRSKVSIVANRVVFLPSKADSDSGDSSSPTTEDSDDIPF